MRSGDITESLHSVLYIRKARKKMSAVKRIEENKSPFTREIMVCFIRKYLRKGYIYQYLYERKSRKILDTKKTGVAIFLFLLYDVRAIEYFFKEDCL